MLELMSAFRRGVYNRLPVWLKRHDFEVIAALGAILSGLPILFHQVSPTSIEALLPEFVLLAWALVLVTGGLLILVGIVAANRSTYPKRLGWMRIEALGLTGLAYFCYIYVVCILGSVPFRGWTAAVFVLVIGSVCHLRKMAILMQIDEYRRNIGVDAE